MCQGLCQIHRLLWKISYGYYLQGPIDVESDNYIQIGYKFKNLEYYGAQKETRETVRGESEKCFTEKDTFQLKSEENDQGFPGKEMEKQYAQQPVVEENILFR